MRAGLLYTQSAPRGLAAPRSGRLQPAFAVQSSEHVPGRERAGGEMMAWPARKSPEISTLMHPIRISVVEFRRLNQFCSCIHGLSALRYADKVMKIHMRR